VTVQFATHAPKVAKAAFGSAGVNFIYPFMPLALPHRWPATSKYWRRPYQRSLLSLLARDSIARYMPSPVRLSVCHTGGSVKDG